MKEKVGLFLSNDEFSKYTYEKLKKIYNPFVISFDKIDFADCFTFSPYEVSKILNFLEKENVKKIVLIARISPSIIFKGNFDNLGSQIIEKTENLTGEDILKNLVIFLRKRGIETLSLKEIFKQEIAEKKIYCGKLTEREKKDINIALSFLSDIEKYRCGQSVTIKNGMIIAVEGIEGTDEMIKRTGKFCSEFVFVKIAGKNKDKRFDLPVIGPETVKNIKRANGKVIAVESKKTIILNKEKIIDYCKKHCITLVGV